MEVISGPEITSIPFPSPGISLAFAFIFVTYLSIETFGAGCNSRPAVWRVFNVFDALAKPASPQWGVSYTQIVRQTWRNSRADGIVRMGEG
jgi:hypothetical protein